MKAILCNLILISIFFTNCKTSSTQITNKQALYDNCMQTFQDEVKCKEFLAKSEDDLKTEAEKNKAARQNLSPEGLSKLKIREEMKDLLVSKNKMFVLNYLGEPEKKIPSGDRDYWVYTRPISRYSPEHDPDEEVTVVLRRGQVDKVNVIKSSTTPENDGFSLRNLLKQKEEKKAEAGTSANQETKENVIDKYKIK